MKDSTEDNVPPDLEQYRICLKLLADLQLNPRLQVREDASEIVQQTTLEAHGDFADFRGRTEAELRAWLKTILPRNLPRACLLQTTTGRTLARSWFSGHPDPDIIHGNQ